MEATQKSKSLKSPKSRIKYLINTFDSLGMGRKEVKEYIDWAFAKKSGRYTIGLGFLASDTCIQEWLNMKKKGSDYEGRISSKWD